MTDHEELPVSNEFITSVKIQLDQEQRQQLLRYLNLHYLGDVNCNEYDENFKIVSKYPEKETKEFKEAVRKTYAEHWYQVKVVYDVNGKCKMELL
jgi:maltose-binding protein MalE